MKLWWCYPDWYTIYCYSRYGYWSSWWLKWAVFPVNFFKGKLIDNLTLETDTFAFDSIQAKKDSIKEHSRCLRWPKDGITNKKMIAFPQRNSSYIFYTKAVQCLYSRCRQNVSHISTNFCMYFAYKIRRILPLKFVYKMYIYIVLI